MRKTAAVLLIAMMLTTLSTEKASASLAGTVMEKTVQVGRIFLEKGKNLVDNLISHFDDAAEIAGRSGDDGVRVVKRLGEKGARFISEFGEEGVSLINKYGDDVVSLSSRNQKRLVRLNGKVDDDLIRLAVKEGDSGIERLARSVTKRKPIQEILYFVDRHLEALLVGIGAFWLADFYASLPGWSKGLLVSLILLGVLGPMIAWVVIRLIRCWRSILKALKAPQGEDEAPGQRQFPTLVSHQMNTGENRCDSVLRGKPEQSVKPAVELPVGLREPRKVPERNSTRWLNVRPWLLALLVALVVALLYWGISTVRFAGRQPIMGNSPTTSSEEISAPIRETPEQRFERKKREVQEEWLEETVRMRQEMDDLVSTRLDMVYEKWVSIERMNTLCDAYYGYWQGWIFTWRQIQDFFVKGSPHSREEMASIVNEKIFFDLEGDLNVLYLDLEDLLKKKVGAFAERTELALSEEFSEEEIASLTDRLEFGSLSATPSEFMAFARTGVAAVDFFLTDKIIEEIFERFVIHFARQETALLATTAAGKGATLTVSITAGGLAKFVGGFALGFALDYLVSKGIRMATEETFREGFIVALEGQKNALRLAWAGGIDEIFKETPLLTKM